MGESWISDGAVAELLNLFKSILHHLDAFTFTNNDDFRAVLVGGQHNLAFRLVLQSTNSAAALADQDVMKLWAKAEDRLLGISSSVQKIGMTSFDQIRNAGDGLCYWCSAQNVFLPQLSEESMVSFKKNVLPRATCPHPRHGL